MVNEIKKNIVGTPTILVIDAFLMEAVKSHQLR